MAKKLNYGIIIKEFESRNCILKSTEYINSTTKLDYICSNGHEHSITWNDFQQGCGCPICSSEATANRLRMSIEYIRSQFEERKCILKSTEYINNKVKLDYICPNGHEHSIRWNDFKKGVGCPYCAGLSKPDILYIKEQFWNKKWILTSTEYVNSHTRLGYICDKGHEHSITWSNFRKGAGCPYCDHETKFTRMLGEKNPMWKGGRVIKPYCPIWSDKEYKLDLKERDSFRCQNPYCSCNGGVLCLHHIDYNPMNCHPSNLITLCNVCHGYSNANRDWHKLYFQTLMSKKYGYIYN